MIIRVTGSIDTDDLPADLVDLTHPMGLSAKGYEQIACNIDLDDVDFRLERE